MNIIFHCWLLVIQDICPFTTFPDLSCVHVISTPELLG